MSKLEELIQKYCPDGVEYVPLSAIGTIKRGNGLQKKDFVQSGVGCIHYGQIYTSFGTFAEKALTYVTEELASHLLHVEKGDLVIACTSENVEDVCKAVAWMGDDTIVTGGHSCVFQHNQNPKYIAYFFQTEDFQQQKRKYAYGTKVIDIKPDNLGKILIPLPPIPVQEEIVRVLDTFTELQAELQAELQKRLQQYNYYRDNLLSNFTPEQEPREYTLEEITTDIYSGATPSKEKKDYWENGSIPWMSSGEVNLGQVHEVEGRITQLGYDKCSTRMVPEGSVVIALAGQGKTRGTVAILRTSVCTNQSLAALIPNPEIVSGEYLYYYLKTQYSKLREVSSGDGTRGGLNLKMLRSYKVLVPSLQTQAQIVSILDRFETLTNNLTLGLPAEIEKRRQQYEYYRDQLLTFKRTD